MQTAPFPAQGRYADGFLPLVKTFASAIERGEEVGAGLTVYHRGRCVVDVYGGIADAAQGRLWEHDTRVVLFSVTKGLAAMGLLLLHDRGLLDYDAPVATYWPGFARGGKGGITVRTLLNHRAGLLGLDEKVTLEDCTRAERHHRLVEAMEKQAPVSVPRGQGYHAITFGMYARELFERVAGEPLGPFLTRELFTPLGADVSLGTDETCDARMAKLYPPDAITRLKHMGTSLLRTPDSTESRVLLDALSRHSMTRRAFLNPSAGRLGLAAYEEIPVRRAQLAWASATGSAHGIARAYLPFASGGLLEDARYVRSQTLEPLYNRQGWSERDAVLQKPLGWSQGFLKEETTVFSPRRESFGHPGMGGALAWCDPVTEVTMGYALNALDWRVRSPRALALCKALYACEPIREDVHAHA